MRKAEDSESERPAGRGPKSDAIGSEDDAAAMGTTRNSHAGGVRSQASQSGKIVRVRLYRDGGAGILGLAIGGHDSRPGGDIGAPPSGAKAVDEHREKRVAMTEFDLTGRVALVTGAGTGIGRAAAARLAGAGAKVGIHFHTSRAGAESLLSEIEAEGGSGCLVQGDLADPESARRVVDDVVAQAGRLDILVNNAGSPVARSKLEDCSLELWNTALATNLTSVFVVTQRAIPHLRTSGHGAIVNNLSLSVQTGGANGAGPYAIAKGGVQVMTRTLAKELAPHVRVNSIMPGVIETPHHERFTAAERMEQYRRETPLGRNGQAAEVASTILFLCSDAARFINGALLDINGGRFLR